MAKTSCIVSRALGGVGQISLSAALAPRTRADGSGPPRRRHPRAAVEPVRPDAGGPADGLGRATELPVTTRRDGRTEMAVLAEGGIIHPLRPGVSARSGSWGTGVSLMNHVPFG